MKGMTEEEFTSCVGKFFDDVMPQIGVLCIQDFANLNELAMELTNRREELSANDLIVNQLVKDLEGAENARAANHPTVVYGLMQRAAKVIRRLREGEKKCTD